MSTLYKNPRTGDVYLEVSSHMLKITGRPEIEMVVLCKSGTTKTMTISRDALSQITDIVTDSLSPT